MENTVAVELIEVTKRYKGNRESEFPAVDNISLRIRNGEFFSLLGPSGCGKSTTLRMIAGFEKLTEGDLQIMGLPISDTPPHLRPVNLVFQNYALFPHMTVFNNVAFGLRMDGVSKTEIRSRVEETLELVQLQGMGDRRPSKLSGGQQQRVALARALVKRPALLLLDEPLGALDRKLRRAMQLELKHMQQKLGITFVYVTHDQEEAMTMSDRIAVMNNGRILQVGSPVDIYEEPVNKFVADFIGESNFIPAVVHHANHEIVSVGLSGGAEITLQVKKSSLRDKQDVTLMVRPEKGTFNKKPIEDVGICSVACRIDEVIYLGNDITYTVSFGEHQHVLIRSQNSDRSDLEKLRKGDEGYINWKTNNIKIFDDIIR